MPTDEANPWDDPADATPATSLGKDAPSPPAEDAPTDDATSKDAGVGADAPSAPADTAAPVVTATAAPADVGPTDPGPDLDAEGEADRRRVLVIAAVAFVVIAAVAFVLTRGGDDDETAASTTTVAGQASAGNSPGGGTGGGAITIAGTSDTFNRDDSDDGLGALPSGAPWVVQSGTWAIRSGEAVVAQPEPEKRNTAFVATGYPDPQAQVRLTTIANGAGMVFRYQGECNFWAVYAVPEFATWNVEKVVDCERIGGEEGSPVFRTITGAPVGSGTTVGVVLSGEQVQIVLNGTISSTFDDPDLAGVGKVGLTTRGDGEVAFDDFVAGGPGGQGVVGGDTPPADGEGGPSTTAAAGDGG